MAYTKLNTTELGRYGEDVASEYLKEKGFKIIIFSNSNRIRLKPFKDELEVDCCARACKPFAKKDLTALLLLDSNILRF